MTHPLQSSLDLYLVAPGGGDTGDSPRPSPPVGTPPTFPSKPPINLPGLTLPLPIPRIPSAQELSWINRLLNPLGWLYPDYDPKKLTTGGIRFVLTEILYKAGFFIAGAGLLFLGLFVLVGSENIERVVEGRTPTQRFLIKAKKRISKRKPG